MLLQTVSNPHLLQHRYPWRWYAPLHAVTWSNSQTGSTFTGLAAGIYTVTVTDFNGCQLVKTVHVNIACVVANKEDGADTSKPISISDSDFLARAYNIGIFQVRAGRLARRMTEHKEVRAFAVMMIKDNKPTNKAVLTLMQKKGFAAPAKLPANLKCKYKDLNQWMGCKFNRKYAAVMVSEHKETIALFMAISMNSKDTDVRQLATQALPLLQTHADSAQALLTKVNTKIIKKSYPFG